MTPESIDAVLAARGFKPLEAYGEQVYFLALPSAGVELWVHLAPTKVVAMLSSGKRCTYPLPVKSGAGFLGRLAAALDRFERAYARVGSLFCPACGGGMRVTRGSRDREPNFRCLARSCPGMRALDEVVPEDEERLALLRRIGGCEAPRCRCGADLVPRVREGGVRFLGCAKFPFCGWTCDPDGLGWRTWGGGAYWENGRWFRYQELDCEDGKAILDAGFHQRTTVRNAILAREREDLGALFWISAMWARRSCGPPAMEIDVGIAMAGRRSTVSLMLYEKTGWAPPVLGIVGEIERKAEQAAAMRCAGCGGPVAVSLPSKGGDPYLHCATQPSCPGMPMTKVDLEAEQTMANQGVWRMPSWAI